MHDEVTAPFTAAPNLALRTAAPGIATTPSALFVSIIACGLALVSHQVTVSVFGSFRAHFCMPAFILLALSVYFAQRWRFWSGYGNGICLGSQLVFSRRVVCDVGDVPLSCQASGGAPSVRTLFTASIMFWSADEFVGIVFGLDARRGRSVHTVVGHRVLVNLGPCVSPLLDVYIFAAGGWPAVQVGSTRRKLLLTTCPGIACAPPFL